jgi:hypothetical protein
MSVTLRVRLNCLVACAASLAMTLAACGGSSSAPKSLPTLPTATDPAPSSASPTPTATSKKAELAAAKAVVTQYYQVANSLKTHMDAPALSALMTATCPCRAQVRAVRDAAQKGEHYIDHAHINNLVPSVEGPAAAFVLVDINASRGGLETADGRAITSAPAAKHIRRVFRLVNLDGHWLIDRIEALK